VFQSILYCRVLNINISVMKKSDHSYKNLYARTDTPVKVPLHQPITGKMSIIENKIDKVSKEIQVLNARRDIKQFHSLKENDPKLTNRLSVEPIHGNLKPRREFKLYTEVDLDDSNYKSRDRI
jgi:hypothetical protein